MSSTETTARPGGEGPAGGAHGGAPGGSRPGPKAPPPGEVPALSTEGWYAFHQLYTIDRVAARQLDGARRAAIAADATAALEREIRETAEGWTAPVRLIGATAELMLVHFRPTLDAVGEVQRRLARQPLFDLLRPAYSFLSVTEAGLYQAGAELAREALARGGAVGDAEHQARLAERVAAERETPHVQKRLFPELPAAMPYVCFYPMSKKREPDANWYALPIRDRSNLMWAHGLTGRRYAGKVSQIVTGAIGFDAWEWGVTLFAADPLEFKRIVTEMRFDEVSARYAEFGDFWVGRVAGAREWVDEVVG